MTAVQGITDVEATHSLGQLPSKETSKSDNKHTHALGWASLDDHENPYNWSMFSKALQLGTIAYLTFLSPFGSTIVASGAADILQDFHTDSETVGSFITSVYLLGYVFGPLLMAPLSEMYGRLPIYHTSNILFVIFNIACAVSPNIGALLAFRFLAGTFGATSLTLGPATIGDLFVPEQRGTALASYTFGSLFGPVAGPVAGGFLIQAKGWRWAFWLLSISSGVGALIALMTLRETSAYIILRHRSRKSDSNTINTANRNARNARQHILHSIVRPPKMMILYPITTGLVLYSACIYGWLYLCFTTYPFVFQQQYGFSNATVGLVYLGVGIGALAGIIFAGVTSDRIYKSLGRKQGGSKPEHRLPLLIFGGVWVPVALFWYGWSAAAKTQFMVPIVGTAFFGFGFVPVFMATSAYLVDAYTQYSASANAVSTIIRSLFGALLPLAGPSLYGSLGIGWGNSLLAFLTIAMLPISLILYRHGERLRSYKTWNGEL